MIGGALARPCDSYPSLFSPGSIWDRYPYLLPNVFSAVIVLIGVVNGLLFLAETHAERRPRRNRGIETVPGSLEQLSFARFSGSPTSMQANVADDETRPLL